MILLRMLQMSTQASSRHVTTVVLADGWWWETAYRALSSLNPIYRRGLRV